MKQLLPVVMMVVASCAMGCSQGAGEIDGGPLVVADCARKGALKRFDPFAMPLHFMALERDEDVVLMRFQQDDALVPLGDSLTMTVEDYRTIRAEIATAGTTRRTHEDGVRVGLVLGDRCPASTAAMTARFVHATFDSLSADGGDRVVFSLVFDLFDERTGQQVGWNLAARGDFEVVLGTPAQQFSDPSQQKH